MVVAGCGGGGGDATPTEGNGGATPTEGDGGGGGGTSTPMDSKFMQEVNKIQWDKDWQDRRLQSLDDWPMEVRNAVPEPESQAWGTIDGWKESRSVQESNWEPPAGWEDTLAGEVNSLGALNYGSLDFDPATAATYALFEEKTGISIEAQELGPSQVDAKTASLLQASEPEPALLQVPPLDNLSNFANNGYLQDVSWLNEGKWNAYLPVSKQGHSWKGRTYMAPNIIGGTMFHVRPQLILDQGVGEEVVNRISQSEWDWNDMETVMEAFEGTNVSGFGYRGSSFTYTWRDWTNLSYQAGANHVDENGNVVLDSEAHLLALEKMIEWLDNGWVPDAVVSWGAGPLSDNFLAGNIAIVPVAGDLTRPALDTFGGPPEYKMVQPPKAFPDAPNPTRRSVVGPTGVGINNFSSPSKKVAAALFLDCRYSTESQWWEYVWEGNLSYMNQVYDQAEQTEEASFSNVRKKTSELGQAEVFPAQRSIRQNTVDQLELAIAGNQSAQEALTASQEFVDTVLSQ